jgi:hypothetical protein
LARWVYLEVTPGKHSKKRRDDLVARCISKVQTIANETFTDITLLQDVARILGLQFSNKTFPTKEKERVIKEVIKNLKTNDHDDLRSDQISISTGSHAKCQFTKQMTKLRQPMIFKDLPGFGVH